jgi:hypothetical protein
MGHGRIGGPRKFRGEPSGPKPPQLLSKKLSVRGILRALRQVLLLIVKLWIWLVDGCIWAAAWVRRNPSRVLRSLWSGFFRIATLISLSYLIYDRLYEIEATISAPLLNAPRPFAFVFTITNNSHLFTIRDVDWTCSVDHMKTTHGNDLTSSGVNIKGSEAKILPGQNLNVHCNGLRNKILAYLFDPEDRITEGTMRVALKYDIDIFGVFTLHPTPPPTTFTWSTEGETPLWIKGPFAN